MVDPGCFCRKWFLQVTPRQSRFIDMKMYVGNLSYDTTKQDLDTLFSRFGTVTDVHMPTDRDTGRVRGFAFVTMDSKQAMDSAISSVNGSDVGGRTLKVNEARSR